MTTTSEPVNEQPTAKPSPLYLGTPMQMTVGYERKYSDGNYGSEGMSLTVTTTVSSDYFVEDHAAMIARALRDAVLTELSHSEAWRVANEAKRELHPPAPKSQPAPAEDEAQPF